MLEWIRGGFVFSDSIFGVPLDSPFRLTLSSHISAEAAAF